jgi:pimeloyl-ACP methyl ester carboxylesterase
MWWQRNQLQAGSLETLKILALALASHGVLTSTEAFASDGTLPAAGLDRTSSSGFRAAGRALSAKPSAMPFQPLGLSMVRSRVSGKIPVVLVHGLWGSPRNWTATINALEADQFVNDRYQFLTFGYTGGTTITYSACRLRRELGEARDRFDSGHGDRAWDRMILIGHSMGGLLCKMVVQDSGNVLWDLIAREPFERIHGPTDARELLRAELVYKPVPTVRRVVFVATPHRGSPLACGAIGDIGSRLVPPPLALRKAHDALIAANGPDAFEPKFRAGLATSLDQLAWESPLLLAIDKLPIDPLVRRHSIIAEQDVPVGPIKGDGLVSRDSARHEGAESELVVPAGHFCLDNPQVIAEVARILRKHAKP